MQHAPHVNIAGTFDVEDDVRKARDRPGPQTREAQFRGVARCPAGRVPADVVVRSLQRMDEAERAPTTGLLEVVVNGSIDVEVGLLARRARNSPTDHAGLFTMTFLRIKQVMQVTGPSRMTIYRLELAGRFPKRRQLNQNSVAWLQSHIVAWVDSRPVARLRSTPVDRATNASA